MSLTYKNRKNDTYYLHYNPKLRSKYCFSKVKNGSIDVLPYGYEIYENPNGMVFMRKIQPKIFSDEEIEAVEKCIEKQVKVKYCKINVLKNSIFVLVPCQDVEMIKEMFKYMPKKDFDAKIQKILSFIPMYRFTLTDKIKRTFDIERACFIGEEEWCYLDTSADIEKLAQKYFKHLGKDSFYELF